MEEGRTTEKHVEWGTDFKTWCNERYRRAGMIPYPIVVHQLENLPTDTSGDADNLLDEHDT